MANSEYSRRIAAAAPFPVRHSPGMRYLSAARVGTMFTTPRLILIALGAALNCAIGTIVYLVKLPIYLDSIGTILIVLLLAPDRMAAFVCAWAAAWGGLAVG